ncbi:P-loop containing nucleoside triphosphate hydrolase protein [Ilyonectria robusta]|uniref:P-loop containing nucleoside triphosphate hydrolase protein n=1 Tax=Ilyonectria robusta TaxID=1079257 RepID=UPI001E8DE638|nr:P-loop containing nucleoside triphosphate hydrolase protein [Ilyonectria robusta]KAH8672363.1 P-loop containing nucleoside triphosphate hydrolase protein [Ilyonectria robusta]
MRDDGTGCSMGVEDAFGPTVVGACAGGFDFTLLFEEGILTLLPLGIALAWASIRLLALRAETAKVLPSWLLAFKMVLFATYVILHISLLVVWLVHDITTTRLTIASIVMTIVGYTLLTITSYLNHLRSIRPSTMLCVYLGTSSLLDLARVRTLFIIPESQTVAPIFLAGFLTKLLMFSLELREKRRLLCIEWKNASPEETSGVINRALFIWLNHIFLKGFRTILSIDTLTILDEEILSASKPTKLASRWAGANKSSKHALLGTFLAHYKWEILAGVLPRVAYTGFSFSQPFLVERVLTFTEEPRDPSTRSTAYGLIGAYAIVYIGLSLSYAVYQHKTYRLLTLFRGSLITLIFGKTLKIDATVTEDAEAITLMSADIDRIGSSMTLIHELYGAVIDTALAIWLLYRLIGLALVAPIVWIILSLIIGVPLAVAAGNAQIPWLEAIEERLAATSKALCAVKAIKMTGLSEIVSSKIANFTSSALAPVWGFTTYILLARSNDSGTLTQAVAFSALSLFELLNEPLGFMIDGFEQVQTVINSFNRIQEYLESSEREEYRSSSKTEALSSNPIFSNLEVSEKKPTDECAPTQSNCHYAVTMHDASAAYASEDGNILKHLNLQIPHGQITMIVGPVGSGKTTLLKLLLGEMPVTAGRISTSFSTAAYCPQSPWITWGTIQNNIVGMSTWDEAWYDSVVRACALPADILELGNGDQTNAGTRGSRLSGGQQMRVSLARALYSRNPVMVLDDVLAGLDRATEKYIIEALFGSTGLFRKLNCTVILSTSSGNRLSPFILKFAHNIIVLNDQGEISEQGTLESISVAGLEYQSLERSCPGATPRPEMGLPEEVLQELEQLETPDPESRRLADYFSVLRRLCRACGWRHLSIPVALWVQWWTNANEKHPSDRLGYWLGVYGGLALITVLSCALADSIFNMRVLPRTARRFHELLLNTTMRAKTSFLTSVDAGTTLNRFSQDLELIDNDLPMSIDQTIFQFFSVIVSAVFVFMGSGYVAAAIPFCILAVVLIQFYYLRTSRQLRLLDIEAKAPLFSHFLDTNNGLTCIRAYGWTQSYLERHYEALNASQKPYYLLWCIQRWLTLVLDLLNAGVAILLVSVACTTQTGSTGFLGVALFNIVTFGSTLQNLVSQWTRLETALGAIGRTRWYVSNVKDENLPDEGGEAPQGWPVHGTITFKAVSASYDSSVEPVLKDISLNSSLISTLAHLLEITSGTISIDDIDISTIPREEVRKRLNTLPQEPFFLHGSVRENVDPREIASDEDIVDALRAVGIWELFESSGGLDGQVNEEKLSHGQRQLFCLARAIVNPARILIIDEATSSIDSDTDMLIQRVLRVRFQSRTVIAVAHKLDTVLDFDRVIVLDKGRIVEVGNPQELLTMPESAFYALHHSVSQVVGK